MSRKTKHRWGRWSITQFSFLARSASGMDRGRNGLSSIKSWPSRCEGNMQDNRGIKIQAKNCTEKEAEAKSSILLPTSMNPRRNENIEDPLPTTYLKVSKLCSQPCWWSFGWHFHSNEIWLHRLTAVAKPKEQITAAESMKRFISGILHCSMLPFWSIYFSIILHKWTVAQILCWHHRPVQECRLPVRCACLKGGLLSSAQQVVLFPITNYQLTCLILLNSAECWSLGSPSDVPWKNA